MTEVELGSGNFICAVAFDGGWSGRTQTQGYGRLVWSLYQNNFASKIKKLVNNFCNKKN